MPLNLKLTSPAKPITAGSDTQYQVIWCHNRALIKSATWPPFSFPSFAFPSSFFFRCFAVLHILPPLEAPVFQASPFYSCACRDSIDTRGVFFGHNLFAHNLPLLRKYLFFCLPYNQKIQANFCTFALLQLKTTQGSGLYPPDSISPMQQNVIFPSPIYLQLELN